MATSLKPEQIAAFVKSFLDTAEAAARDEANTASFANQLSHFYSELLGVFTTDGEMSLRFGDGVIYLNTRKVRLSGSAGERLARLLAIAHQANWEGFSCEEVPNEDQVSGVLSRFTTPETPSQDPSLLRRIGPFRWVGETMAEAGLDESKRALDMLSEDALETSMVRKVQIKEIVEALGTHGGDELEAITFLYARAVYFVERFMATIEPGGPRVPLDEASRIVCDLVDSWSSDPKGILVMAMARPQLGNYDAFHQANTALLSIAMGGSLGMGRADLFEVGLAALLHQVGIVDMPDRIRYNRVLQKDERDVLTQIPYHTARRLLQAHGPDLHAMTRLNAIVAMKNPVAQKKLNQDGKAILVHAKPKPPLMARIVSVAARYDALTSKREFRAAMAPKKAITLMLRQPLALETTLVRLLAKLQNVAP